MHQLPRHSEENDHILTNEWNNSFVDGVRRGVEVFGLWAEDGETRGRDKERCQDIFTSSPLLPTHGWGISSRFHMILKVMPLVLFSDNFGSQFKELRI